MRQGRGPSSSVHRRLRARVLSRSSPQARGRQPRLARPQDRPRRSDTSTPRRVGVVRSAAGPPTAAPPGRPVGRRSGATGIALPDCAVSGAPCRVEEHTDGQQARRPRTPKPSTQSASSTACLVSRLNSIAPSSSSNFNECSSIWACERAVALFPRAARKSTAAFTADPGSHRLSWPTRPSSRRRGSSPRESDGRVTPSIIVLRTVRWHMGRNPAWLNQKQLRCSGGSRTVAQ